MKQVTRHRELLDAIDSKSIRGLRGTNRDYLYSEPNYLSVLKKEIIESKKFYIGNLDNVPDLDVTKKHTHIIKLPFPITLFEVSLVPLGIETNQHMVIICHQGLNEEIHFRYFTLYESLKHWSIVPALIHITKEEGFFSYNSTFDSHYVNVITNSIFDIDEKFESIRKYISTGHPIPEEINLELLESKMMEQRQQLLDIDTIKDAISYAAELITGKLISILTLLNCKNVTYLKHQPTDEKLNKARVRRGKNKDDVFYTLTIDKSRMENMFLYEEGEEGEKGTIRYHWRRGHLKQRKSGVYWWGPHAVGKKENGEVHKDYEIKHLTSSSFT